MPRLAKFEFSVDTTFFIEVGDGYMRFLKNAAYVMNGSTPYAIFSPYAEADVFDVQFQELNDVIFLTHPDYPPYKLSRVADNNWTLAAIVFDVPATLDENIDDTLTITPSGTSGSITLASSAALFDSGHVGSYWRIGHFRDADTVELAISGNSTSSTLEIIGPWSVRTYGIWTADLLVERQRVSGGSWEEIKRIIASGDRNSFIEGTADENFTYRLRVENYSSNTDARAVLERAEATIYGTVKITSFSSDQSVGATVVHALQSTDATFFWREAAWSEYRGYPRAVTFHEARIWYGGTAHDPLTVWGSVVDDFENFATGTADDDAVVFQMASAEFNAIQWMTSKTDLLIGTAGSEWRVRGDRNGQPITPSRIDAKEQSRYGSEYIQPVTIGGQVIFLERRGRTLREMVYSYEVERFVSDTNLNLLAEHRTEAGIKQMAFSRMPVPTIWCVMLDGTLSAFTYDRAQNVTAWHWHDTDGTFESVASSYGSPDTEDEVYFIVTRTVNSAEVQFIERFDSNRWTSKEDAFFVDCGLTYDGSPVTEVTGMDHLAGRDVDVLADGRVYQGITVGMDGSVALPSGETAASVWQVGLPFTAILSPFRFDADSVLGVHSGMKKRIDNVVLRLYRSVGMKIEVDGTNYEVKVPEDKVGNDPDNPPLLGQERPEDVDTNYAGETKYDPTIVITQDKPLPLSVMSINVGYKVSSG